MVSIKLFIMERNKKSMVFGLNIVKIRVVVYFYLIMLYNMLNNKQNKVIHY